MLKVGIIGCGNIFTMHATSCDYLKTATLVAVCDVKKERADRASKKYGVKAYTDIETMLRESQVEVVSICTPHRAHAASAIKAADCGVHILCEKPLATKLKDCDADRKSTRLNSSHVF